MTKSKDKEEEIKGGGSQSVSAAAALEKTSVQTNPRVGVNTGIGKLVPVENKSTCGSGKVSKDKVGKSKKQAKSKKAKKSRKKKGPKKSKKKKKYSKDSQGERSIHEEGEEILDLTKDVEENKQLEYAQSSQLSKEFQLTSELEEKIAGDVTRHFKLIIDKKVFLEIFDDIFESMYKGDPHLQFLERAKFTIQHIGEKLLIFYFSQLVKVADHAGRDTIYPVDFKFYGDIINSFLQYDSLKKTLDLIENDAEDTDDEPALPEDNKSAERKEKRREYKRRWKEKKELAEAKKKQQKDKKDDESNENNSQKGDSHE